VLQARSGDPVIALNDSSDTRRLFHSKYQPRDEALRALPEVKEDDSVASFIFFGAGFGYGPLALLERLTGENRIIWLESDARLFRTLLERVDIARVLDHPGSMILVAGTARDVHEMLMDKLRLILSSPIRMIAHIPSQQMYPEPHAAYKKAIQDFMQEAGVQVRTAMYLSRHSIKNEFANLYHYLRSPGYNYLRNILVGKPAILIAAGPSLRKNIELLHEAVGKITTLAVSTTLRPVLQRGIKPDFTAVIDYHRISKRYFEGIEADQAPPIISDLKATSEAFEVYGGKALFGNDLIINTLFDGIFGDMGEFTPGSTVAHNAFHFLEFLGADPIILVGQDLSYPGGMVHVPGTTIQTQEFPSTHRFYSLEMRELEYYYYYRNKFKLMDGNLGGKVPTDEVFFSYLKEFERIFANSKARVINATEGGARIEGTEVATLEEVLTRYADARSPDFKSIIEAACADRVAQNLQSQAYRILGKRRRQLKKLKSLYANMIELIEIVVTNNRDGLAADKEVEEIHKLHRKSQKFSKVFLLLSHLVQSDGWRRLKDDRRMDASDTQGVLKQKEQGQRDLEYIKGLHVACDYLYECFERASEELSVA